MSEPNNCIILPSIDRLPLTQLYLNFFQEQEEKAKTFFRSIDINHSFLPPIQQINSSYNYNVIKKESDISFFDQKQEFPSNFTDNNNKNNFNFEQHTNSGQNTLKLKGSWSPEEDNKLREAVANCDPILWDIVAEKVPGRSAIQCKERWLYRLHPDVKKTRFEKWEDDLIIEERKKVGNHWTLISNKLPGRTSCAVKNRWYSVLRNRFITNDPLLF